MKFREFMDEPHVNQSWLGTFDPEEDDPADAELQRMKFQRPVRTPRHNAGGGRHENPLLDKGREFYQILKDRDPELAQFFLDTYSKAPPEEKEELLKKIRSPQSAQELANQLLSMSPR